MIIIKGQARMCDKYFTNRSKQLECCRNLAHVKMNDGYKCLKHFREDFKGEINYENVWKDYEKAEPYQLRIILEHHQNNKTPNLVELANNLSVSIDFVWNISQTFKVQHIQL